MGTFIWPKLGDLNLDTSGTLSCAFMGHRNDPDWSNTNAFLPGSGEILNSTAQVQRRCSHSRESAVKFENLL